MRKKWKERKILPLKAQLSIYSKPYLIKQYLNFFCNASLGSSTKVIINLNTSLISSALVGKNDA